MLLNLIAAKALHHRRNVAVKSQTLRSENPVSLKVQGGCAAWGDSHDPGAGESRC